MSSTMTFLSMLCLGINASAGGYNIHEAYHITQLEMIRVSKGGAASSPKQFQASVAFAVGLLNLAMGAVIFKKVIKSV